MLSFQIVDMGDLNFRCVLGEESFFDFSIYQLELFAYEDFFTYLKNCIGCPLYTIQENKEIGELVSVKYLKQEDSIWVLIRNGTKGELYRKDL